MKRVLFLVAHPIEDAGCRYRVYQFLPYLENAGYEMPSSALLDREPVSSFGVVEVISRGRFFTPFIVISDGFSAVSWSRAVRFGGHSSRGISFFAPALENAVLRRSRKVIDTMIRKAVRRVVRTAPRSGALAGLPRRGTGRGSTVAVVERLAAICFFFTGGIPEMHLRDITGALGLRGGARPPIATSTRWCARDCCARFASARTVSGRF